MNFFKNSRKLQKERLEITSQEARKGQEIQAREEQIQANKDLEAALAQQKAWARQQDEDMRRVENELRREEMRQAELDRQAAERKKLEEKERRQSELDRQAVMRKRIVYERQKWKEASPEALRVLRELIRDRYELDVEIWGLRGAKTVDMPIVQRKMVSCIRLQKNHKLN